MGKGDLGQAKFRFDMYALPGEKNINLRIENLEILVQLDVFLHLSGLTAAPEGPKKGPG